MKRLLILVLCLDGSMLLALVAQTSNSTQPEAFLSWTRQHALEVGRGLLAKGRVTGSRGLLHTERSRDYKLRATRLTPDVIRASARLAQLSQRLTDEQTVSLVNEAERAGDTVVMVEIDPREGSGVIPNDWEAFLQPKGEPTLAVAGLRKEGQPARYEGTQWSLSTRLRLRRFLAGFPFERTSPCSAISRLSQGSRARRIHSRQRGPFGLADS